jgi:CBS domain containing-hemolysin-like protein
MTNGCGSNEPISAWRRGLSLVLGCLACLPAHASFLHGEALDTVASVLALIVIIVVPIVLIVLFWMVHVLPEKIAHKRHHPQTQAIQVLCLLSLVFGGMLWPLAWLWAYTKPVLHKMAYGTDKHEDYDAETATTADAEHADDAGLSDEVARVRDSLDRVLEKGGAPAELTAIRDRLAALEPRLAAAAKAGAGGAG